MPVIHKLTMKDLKNFILQVRQVVFAQVKKNFMIGFIIMVGDKVAKSDNGIGVNAIFF